MSKDYQQIQAIYLDWHKGKRPLSGYINDIQALLDEATREARISELEQIANYTIPGTRLNATETVAFIDPYRVINRLAELNEKGEHK